jgi:glycosyltransferase involved in cell wall biosynthesis
MMAAPRPNPDVAASVAASGPLTVVIANCWFDPDIPDPEQLLARYHGLTGWADAVAGAGATTVVAMQRFARHAVLRRGSVVYRFVADAGPAEPSPWFLGSRFARAIADLRPDVVHVAGFIFPAFVRCLRVWLPRRTAIVVQDHGGVSPLAGGVLGRGRRLLYRLGLGAADAFLFTSRGQAEPWQRAGIIRARHAVHDVIESSTDMASWPRPAGDAAAAGSPALLWVGRLDTNKDPLTVLEGFAGAAAALPQATLTMVYGDDVLLPAVEAWIAAHPALRARIHLRGRVERAALPALYASADLFVIGSHREVACFSLIEALSFGVTPVVTDIVPFRAITAGGRVGALYRPGDPDALARALPLAWAGDPQARRESVRAHFERALSWPAVGARAVAAYRSAASARRTGVGA